MEVEPPGYDSDFTLSRQQGIRGSNWDKNAHKFMTHALRLWKFDSYNRNSYLTSTFIHRHDKRK